MFLMDLSVLEGAMRTSMPYVREILGLLSSSFNVDDDNRLHEAIDLPDQGTRALSTPSASANLVADISSGEKILFLFPEASEKSIKIKSNVS